MVERGGGVVDVRVRELKEPFSKQYSVDIFVNVCEAMGANITNTLCEKVKDYISKMGIKTGIAILTNYCVERKALSYFEIPVKEMGWKGVTGSEVASKMLEAYEFAKIDKFRATTHNKGIMNGIDGVCVATGQDWRAV
jgi:hydroxymethylglutaryl-CoA synthase